MHEVPHGRVGLAAQHHHAVLEAGPRHFPELVIGELAVQILAGEVEIRDLGEQHQAIHRLGEFQDRLALGLRDGAGFADADVAGGGDEDLLRITAGFGDGGLLVTSDDTLAERARLLRTHGSKPKYYHKAVGGNFRLDPLQAALLRVKLAHYSEYTTRRQANADHYSSALAQLPGVVPADPAHCKCATSQDAWLADSGARIVLPVPYAHNSHIWNQFTLRIIGQGQRDAFKNHLTSLGIGCEIYYPVTMDQQECFAYTSDAARADCATAHRLASEVISIPIFPELSAAQRDAVIAAVASFLAA
jgi:dTDP-4-amino-4,6-dideoxygalactose transaminase